MPIKLYSLLTLLLLFNVQLLAANNKKEVKQKTIHFGLQANWLLNPMNSINFLEDSYDEYYGVTTFKNYNDYNNFEISAFVEKTINKKFIIGINTGFSNYALDFEYNMQDISPLSIFSIKSNFKRSIFFETLHIGSHLKYKINKTLIVGFDIKLVRNREYYEKDRLNNSILNWDIRTNAANIVSISDSLSYGPIAFNIIAYENYDTWNEFKQKTRRMRQHDFVPSVFLQYYPIKNVFLTMAFNFRFWADKQQYYIFQLEGHGDVFTDYFEEKELLYRLTINDKSIHPKFGIGCKF